MESSQGGEVISREAQATTTMWCEVGMVGGPAAVEWRELIHGEGRQGRWGGGQHCGGPNR